jgi:hypothetical protein
LANVYALPDKNDEPALFYVIQSAERILERLHAQLKESTNNDHLIFRVLHRQIVNTFRGNKMNVDLINALQNAKSLKIYITIWKQALYYFYRVSMKGYLREDLFKSITEQTAGFAALLEAAQNRPASVSESGADHYDDDDDDDDDDHDYEALQGAWEKEIDDWMLKFLSALIQ